MTCIVDIEGFGRRCVVDNEVPENANFAQAAMDSVSSLRFNPATLETTPVESLATFVLSFRISQAPTVQPSKKLAEIAQQIDLLGFYTGLCRNFVDAETVKIWDDKSELVIADLGEFQSGTVYDQIFGYAYARARKESSSASVTSEWCAKSLAVSEEKFQKTGGIEELERVLAAEAATYESESP